MLPTYSSPQCWEPRQDYPCFTNQVAGTGEVKPAFLRATDPGRVRAQLRSKDGAGLHDCCPVLPATESCSSPGTRAKFWPDGLSHLFPETRFDPPEPNRVIGVWEALSKCLLIDCIISSKDFIVVHRRILVTALATVKSVWKPLCRWV